MNDEDEIFERRLKRQALRSIPAEWRDGIVAAAKKVQSARRSDPVTGPSIMSSVYSHLASILWPHPVAWGGLATIWVFVLAVHFSIRDTRPVVAEAIRPPTPEVMAELRQQRRLFVELSGASDSSDADQQKFIPKPRSERAGILMT